MPSPDLHAEGVPGRLGVADRVGNPEVAAAFVEQVDGERVERRQPGDELRDLLEELVEIENGRHLTAELEQRQEQRGRLLDSGMRVGLGGRLRGRLVHGRVEGTSGLYLRASGYPVRRRVRPGVPAFSHGCPVPSHAPRVHSDRRPAGRGVGLRRQPRTRRPQRVPHAGAGPPRGSSRPRARKPRGSASTSSSAAAMPWTPRSPSASRSR